MRGCWLPFGVCLAVACGKGGDPGARGPDDAKVERTTLVENTPTGTRTTVITKTTRTVEAPPPPPRPEDPYPADPLVKYNVQLINEYRANAGAPPLLYDARISAFALEGSRRLARDHAPHANFVANQAGAPGFGSRSAENQGEPNGVPAMATDAVTNGKKQIALMMKLMFDEGPGGGHHDNMLNPRFRRVGIGLHYAGGRLYLTNDFSD